MVMLGLLVGSTVGGFLGSAIGHNYTGLGGWSILLSAVGGIAGIWLGYRISRNW